MKTSVSAVFFGVCDTCSEMMTVVCIDSLLLSRCTLTIEPSAGQGAGLVQTHKRLRLQPEVAEETSTGTAKEQSCRHEERGAAVGEASAHTVFGTR